MGAIAVFVALIAADATPIVAAPSAGRPAIVTPGGAFEVFAAHDAELGLNREGRTSPVNVNWTDRLGAYRVGECTVPPDTPSGRYDLTARVGDELFTVVRAVYVVEEFPDTYAAAHVVQPAFDGSPEHARELDAAVARANEFGAALAFLSFESAVNEPGAKRLQSILETAPIPIFVVNTVEGLTAPGPTRVSFGQDDFLFFDSAQFQPGRNVDGRLYQLTRTIRPGRWNIGVTTDFDVGMDVRAQLVLFVDNPLHALICNAPIPTETTKEQSESEKDIPPAIAVPWGRTESIPTPPATGATFRLIRIGPTAVDPGAVVTPDTPLPPKP